MDRPDTRSASIPTPSTSMSKASEASSGATPGATTTTTTEASVAYQYVAVQQMTSNRDHIEYQLTIREQPKQSRMCGVGEKADRRPIDPAPIVQLRVITHDRPVRQTDTVESTPAHPPIQRRPGHGPSAPRTPGVRRGLPVTTALGDGWEDKAWYLENPYFFMYAMLCNADTDEELHLLNDGKTRYTSGSCVSCLYHLKDIDGSHQGFFVFPDLSIRVEGRYRLKLCLFETIGHSVHHCKSIYSDPFHVYTAKRFPGMEESTRLSKSFAEQGLKVRVRKHPRSRRRGSKRAKDESDASDDTPLARDHGSPKRARVSDVLPASGLPIPQPLAAAASSRMPRSMDARYERAEYEQKPLMAAQDLKRADSTSRRTGWQEQEAKRSREQRSWDTRYEQPMHPLHPRDDRQPPPPPREFEARYVDDYPPPPPVRTRAAAPHQSMRYAPDYPDPHLRAAYVRSDGPPPPPLSVTPPPSMMFRGGGFAEHPPPPPSPAAYVGAAAPQHGRSYPPAAAPMPSRPARAARSYAADHADPSARYDDYHRYNAPYRLAPPSPPTASSEYRSPYPPQWRSGPPSPNRPGEYAAEREWRSPIVVRASTPAAAFVPSSSEGYRRFERAYEESMGLSPTRPAGGYTRDEGSRFGTGMLAPRERPMLPPLGSDGGERSERFLPHPPPGFRPAVEEWDDHIARAPDEYRRGLSRPLSRPY